MLGRVLINSRYLFDSDVLDLGKEAPVIGSKVEGVPCPDLALLGPREMSDLSPQSGPKRTMIRVAEIYDVGLGDYRYAEMDVSLS
jgi:hypothetical protein